MNSLYIGRFKRGEVSETREQYKKHKLQMNSKEIKYLLNKVRSIDKFYISEHTLEKIELNLLSFNMEDIKRILKNATVDNLIEFNMSRINHSRRVLLRDLNTTTIKYKKGTFTDANLCFVIDLDTSIIITAYYVDASDKHDTLNWSRYSPNLKIV